MTADNNSENSTSGNRINDDEFNKLFYKYFPKLAAYCGWFLHDFDRGKDIAQETFIRLTKISIDPTKSIWGLLRKIAHNLCIDVIKRENRLRILHDKSSVDQKSHYDPTLDPKDDRHVSLQGCLEELKQQYLAALLKCRLFELTLKTIAEEEGISIAMISKRRNLAEKQMRECLKKKGVFPMKGSKPTSGLNNLIKDYAKTIEQNIASEFKRTESCLKLEALRHVAAGASISEDSMAHIAKCKYCGSLVKNWKKVLSEKQDAADLKITLADFLKKLSDEIRSPTESTELQATGTEGGYFCEQTELSEEDQAAENGLCEELLGLLDIVMNDDIPIKERANLVAELHDLATAKLRPKRKRHA